MNEDTCNWQETEGYWQTSCGEEAALYDGTPWGNRMRYCCYCGDPVEQTLENYNAYKAKLEENILWFIVPQFVGLTAALFFLGWVLS
jgi:hypothetical protein